VRLLTSPRTVRETKVYELDARFSDIYEWVAGKARHHIAHIVDITLSLNTMNCMFRRPWPLNLPTSETYADA